VPVKTTQTPLINNHVVVFIYLLPEQWGGTHQRRCDEDRVKPRDRTLTRASGGGQGLHLRCMLGRSGCLRSRKKRRASRRGLETQLYASPGAAGQFRTGRCRTGFVPAVSSLSRCRFYADLLTEMSAPACPTPDHVNSADAGSPPAPALQYTSPRSNHSTRSDFQGTLKAYAKSAATRAPARPT
jgi:hypothetical protein